MINLSYCFANCLFRLQAFIGTLLFGEPLSLRWFSGLAFLLAGLRLILSGTQPARKEKTN